MASSELSHLSSLASTHKPPIATTLIILIISCVSLVPYFALSSSKLIPSAFPNIAYTLWDSLWGLASSSPFFFFMLNFLIVALVCLSGVLGPSSKSQGSAELQDGDPLQSDSYSAAHFMHDRLAFDEIYGSHTPSPSYLRVIERSNVYVVDEEHCDDSITKPATLTLLQNPAGDDMIGYSSHAHPSRAPKDIELDANESSMTRDTLVVSPVTSLVIANGHIADRQDETNFHKKRDIECQKDHHEDRDVREEAGDCVDNGKIYDDANCLDGAAESDAQFGVDGADKIDAIAENLNDHGDDGDAFHKSNASTQPLQAPIPQLAKTTRSRSVEYGQVNVAGEDELESKDVSSDAREPSEEKAGEGQERDAEMEMKMEMAMDQQEREEEQMPMSREELNERASAFISAFRRKLSSTAIVDP